MARLGFWKAAGLAETREQRSWVHKTAHSGQVAEAPAAGTAKRALQERQLHLELGHPQGSRLGGLKERGLRRVAFYDFPAEHWKHRTTNPIESTFATVRHGTIRRRAGLSNRTALVNGLQIASGGLVAALAKTRGPGSALELPAVNPRPCLFPH